MVIVLTIISLIIFFVLADETDGHDGANKNVAEFEVNVVELVLYILTTVVVVIAMWQMRDLKYDRKVKGEIRKAAIHIER